MNYQNLSAWPYRSFTTLIMLFAAMSMSTSALADHKNSDDWRKSNWENDHIVVFSQCNFSGRSKSIPPGDYQAMRRVGVEQNAISSILIPSGLAVEIFEKRGFEGHWYRLNQNQTCLQGNWRNNIGSMRVIEDDVKNSYGFSTDYNRQDSRCYPFTVRTNRGTGGYRLVDSERRLTEVGNRSVAEGEICDQKSVQVELAKRDQRGAVVMDVAGKQYRFGPGDRYDDFRRDWYRQYVTIELPKRHGGRNNQVYGGGNWGNTRGFGVRYSSGVQSGDNWGNNYRGNWFRSGGHSQGNNKPGSHAACVSYRVIGNHAGTGMRFLSRDQRFYRVGDGSIKGEWCERGMVRVELAKKNPSSTIVIQIGGGTYAFRGNDKGDRFENDWYRKYVTIDLH